jgi:hypothetical protein
MNKWRYSSKLLPNVVVERITLLLRIREVPGSDLGPGYRLTWLRVFVVFLIPSRRIAGWYLKIITRSLPTKSFPIHHHPLMTLPSTPYRLVTKKHRKINYQPSSTLRVLQIFRTIVACRSLDSCLTVMKKTDCMAHGNQSQETETQRVVAVKYQGFAYRTK